MLNMRAVCCLGIFVVANSAATVYAQPKDNAADHSRGVQKQVAHYLRSCACSPDGKWIVAADVSEIRLFKSGASEAVAVIPRSAYSTKVCFSPTEPDTFAVGDTEGNVSLFRVGATEPHLTFALDEEARFRITGLAFSPDGKQISVTATEIRDCKVVRGVFTTRDSTTGNEVFGEIIDKADVKSLAYSQDGKQLAVAVHGGDESHARILSAINGKESRSIPFPGFAHTILFTPDSTRLIMLGGQGYPTPPDPDYGVMYRMIGHLWIADLTSTNPAKQFARERGYFGSGFVTDDGRAFLAEGESKLELRSTETGNILWSRPKDEAKLLCFSPDFESVLLFNTDRESGDLLTTTVSIAR